MHSNGIKQNVELNSSGSHLVPNKPNRWFVVRRCTVAALVVLLSVIGAYRISLRLVSQIHHLRGEKYLQQGYYGLASHDLENAALYQPKDYNIQRDWGDALHQKGKLAPRTKNAYASAQSAKKRYQEALRLNPFDAQSAYGLAVAEARLEQLFTIINPGEPANPYHALPYYEMAIRLRPNGILYHYGLSQYLYRTYKVTEKMLQVVHNLARIYPPAFHSLKKEEFWSLAVKAACRKGLQQAIDDKISPAAAHMALVEMAIQERNWTIAIAHSQKVLEIQPHRKTEQAYYQLGLLFLRNRELQSAQASFLDSLSLSRTREELLRRIYRSFKGEGMLSAFNGFYQQVQQRFALSARAAILLANSFIEAKQYDRARRVLEESNADEPTGEAYYWLAVVAEKQTDWKQMELAIQKATVLEPENNHYRKLFFRLLKKMKKFDRAELQLGLIISHSDRPSANFYNEKAWLRWKKKDYDGARQAWQTAIRLRPDSAAYYAQSAEASIMIGNWLQAKSSYRKAIELDPHNKRYIKRYREIVEKNSAEG